MDGERLFAICRAYAEDYSAVGHRHLKHSCSVSNAASAIVISITKTSPGVRTFQVTSNMITGKLKSLFRKAGGFFVFCALNLFRSLWQRDGNTYFNAHANVSLLKVFSGLLNTGIFICSYFIRKILISEVGNN